jgi:hypothetical protein
LCARGVGVGVGVGLALTEGLGIGVGVGVGTGGGVGKGVVLGGAVGVKVGVGAGVGVAVGAGVGVGVGTGLTDRPQPNRRNPTRRRKTATLRSRSIAKHPCKTRCKLQAVKQTSVSRRQRHRHHVLGQGRRKDLPAPLSFFQRHDLAVVAEDHLCRKAAISRQPDRAMPTVDFHGCISKCVSITLT